MKYKLFSKSGLRVSDSLCGSAIGIQPIVANSRTRTFPMATAFGMSITPWGVMGGGALTGKYLKGDTTGRVPETSLRRTERNNYPRSLEDSG